MINKINNLILELNSLCNNNCSYCYLKNRTDGGENSFDFFREKILEFSKQKVKNIDFTGGEPTLYPFLTDLIGLAKEAGYEHINLITNGRMLAYKDYCRKVLEQGINRVVISIDGPNKEVTEAITRTPGSFNQTIQAMQNVKELNCELGVTVVINKLNYRHLPQIVERCISLNVDFMNFQYILPFIDDEHIDCRKLPSSIIPSYNETLDYVKNTLDRFGDKIKINVHFAPFCYLEGYDKNLIEESSKLDRYAVNYRGFGYNIGKHLLKGAVRTGKCLECKHKSDCIGFFKSYAKEFGIESEFKKDNKKTKTLFFKNLFISIEGKENNDWFHQATFYLVSSFKNNNLPFEICNSKFSTEDSELLTKLDELDSILENNPDINLIAITLLEDCFDKTKRLIDYLRKKTNAYIAVGGIMPTLTPRHVFEHLPEANIIVQGDGEEIFPKIKNILEGKYYNDSLTEDEKNSLRSLRGAIVRNKYETIYSLDQSENVIENLDNSILEFSLLEKDHIAQGLNLSTSRGCHNSCFFCTMPNRRKYRAKTLDNLKCILVSYKKRLIEIYGDMSNIPKEAFRLSFNDDDFLGDRKRAIEFFRFIKSTEFKINFIQAAINSFFIKEEGRPTDLIDRELVESMDPDIFYSDANKSTYSIYIGTENFCDSELDRLGKGYHFYKVEKVVEALSNQKIMQAHHLILTNTETELDNIIENLIKIVELKIKYKRYFNILLPVISNLVSLYPSASYKMLTRKYGLKNLKVHGWLRSKDHPELDYPLVEKDIPLDPDVNAISERSNNLIKKEDNYEVFIEKLLIFLLDRLENIRIENREVDRIKKLEEIIFKYSGYIETIKRDVQDTSSIFQSNKNNIQIMLTRRCTLRCTYCPVPKKNSDMDLTTLKRAIDLLFTSNQKNLRVDFTGGEPLLRFDLMKEGIDYAIEMSKKTSKEVSFYIVTNGLNLSKEIVDFLDNKNVLLELSIDGEEETHNRFKIPVEKTINPYRITTENVKYTLDKNINKYVVIVTTPQTVANLHKNFRHILDLGFKKIEINYAIGSYWDSESQIIFFSELRKIINEFKKELRSNLIELGNFKKRKEPAILNSEFMIDTDGTIKLLNEFLYKSDVVKESPYKFGKIYDYNSINQLYLNKFTVYYSLIKMFGENNPEIRRMIKNNISMGLLCDKFFRIIGKELKL